MQYYNDVLSNTLSKMSREDLSDLGVDINAKTKYLSLSTDYSNEDLTSMFYTYASKYIRSNPKEFGINANGGIEWLGSK